MSFQNVLLLGISLHHFLNLNFLFLDLECIWLIFQTDSVLSHIYSLDSMLIPGSLQLFKTSIIIYKAKLFAQ